MLLYKYIYKITDFNGKIVIALPYIKQGICLGEYMIVPISKYRDHKYLNYEYGHCIQSK